MPAFGLALSGGGSKGAFTVGALQILLGRFGSRSVEVISGTSTGALIGTMLCSNQFAEVLDLYRNVTDDDILDPHHPLIAFVAGAEAVLFASAVLGGKAIYGTAPLRELIETRVRWDRVKGSSKVLTYSTVSLQSGQHVAFSNQEHSVPVLKQALLASASMPVLMDPVEIRHPRAVQQFVDGGVLEFLPLANVYDHADGLDRVFAFSTAPLRARADRKKLDQIVKILGRTIELLESEVARGDVREALLINAVWQVLEAAEGLGVKRSELLAAMDPEARRIVKGKRCVPLTVIAPRDHIALDSLRFDPPRMRALVDEGAKAAEAVLDGLEG